jgi:hypothetical protein
MPTRVDSVPRPVKPPIPVLSATRTNDERVGQIGIGGDRAADVGGEDSIPIQCHGSAKSSVNIRSRDQHRKLLLPKRRFRRHQVLEVLIIFAAFILDQFR